MTADPALTSPEQIGSGPQTYRWAVSVAVDGDGTPWVSYFDGQTSSLQLAGRTNDGWTAETVDDAGHTGLYSELAIDTDGGQHISYFEPHQEVGKGEITTSGSVKYAHRPAPESAWQISEVDRLAEVAIGFTGARNITSIALDETGTPWLAYSDETAMRLAHLQDGGWQIETVAEAADLPLGQIVSLELAATGQPHIAFADASSKGPLDGSIWYATRGLP